MRSRTPMRPVRCHAHHRGTHIPSRLRHASNPDVGNSRPRPKSLLMSAAEGVVHADALGPAPTCATRFAAIPPSSDVSPELALIDADLARELRAHLAEPPATPLAPVVEPVRAQTVLTEPQPEPAREGGRRSRKLRILGLAALGVLLAVLVRNEPRPSPLDRITRAAAGPNAEARPRPFVPARTAAAAATTAGQTFVWAAEPGAAAYEFQLFRGDARIYRARTTSCCRATPP